jgi:hypothetical protein
MPPSPPTGSPPEEEIEQIVPARAVLTELARGFLLVRENDRERAVRFAATFLRERAEASRAPRTPAYPAPAQRVLGRAGWGPVERLDRRPPR